MNPSKEEARNAYKCLHRILQDDPKILESHKEDVESIQRFLVVAEDKMLPEETYRKLYPSKGPPPTFVASYWG